MGLAKHSDLRAPEGEATDVQMMRLNFASKDIEYVIPSAVVREDPFHNTYIWAFPKYRLIPVSLNP